MCRKTEVFLNFLQYWLNISSFLFQTENKSLSWSLIEYFVVTYFDIFTLTYFGQMLINKVILLMQLQSKVLIKYCGKIRNKYSLFVVKSFYVLKAEEMTRSFYEIPWYLCDFKFKKTFNIVQTMMIKQPINITAGKFFAVNLSTYLSVRKRILFLHLNMLLSF